MQQIFLTLVSPAEYARQGVDFEFPVPDTCPNPECLIPIPPKKHGFYERNCLDFTYRGRILIRRYYCPYCGKTVSYLPSFCLPYYQYSLAVIYLVICNQIESNMSYAQIIRHFRKHHQNLHLYIQHVEFYLLRFLMNLTPIQIGLRQLLPGIPFPEPGDISLSFRNIFLKPKQIPGPGGAALKWLVFFNDQSNDHRREY